MSTINTQYIVVYNKRRHNMWYLTVDYDIVLCYTFLIVAQGRRLLIFSPEAVGAHMLQNVILQGILDNYEYIF